ncbi:helix-turn-helix domain-containing protein [uncultured Thermomonospora sp.]|uniref:helix-turn-helix domain-containing protein n=1 Tax=uncultured Thermomonospora sp. TaxID=671175 RepID=UPI00259AEEF5|nr:helix-turn-helix domain-containing protein [uncultured Thermomonospora sp.]
MVADAAPERIGIRIARERKRRGLTQLGLAQRANYSRSHIAQVEAGHKAATPAFVAAVAEALEVDPALIYGQPYRGVGSDDKAHAAIPELRRILACVGAGPEPDRPPRGLDELERQIRQARRLLLQVRLTRLGMMLPAVLEELTWHAYETDSPKAWGLLFRAYYEAVSLTRRLGYTGDALALLERAADAARRSQDPHLPLLVSLPRALLLMSMNQNRTALRLLNDALSRVEADRPDAGEVAGALELRAAVVAARTRDGVSEAWEHHGRAAELAEAGRVGDGRHGMEFGMSNVAVHGAAIAVELGDLDEAVRRDRDIRQRQVLEGMAPERRAHHEIDMSRALLELGDYDQALARVENAERIASQMTYFHPSARSVVAHLVDVRRTLPEPLRRLQSRMGV